MIKAVFTYTTKKEYLPELMERFRLSADSKFASDVSNTGIKMYKKDDGDIITIVLDIFYHSLTDYEQRTAFEREHPDWNDIWFSDHHHTLESVEIFECLS